MVFPFSRQDARNGHSFGLANGFGRWKSWIVHWVLSFAIHLWEMILFGMAFYSFLIQLNENREFPVSDVCLDFYRCTNKKCQCKKKNVMNWKFCPIWITNEKSRVQTTFSKCANDVDFLMNWCDFQTNSILSGAKVFVANSTNRAKRVREKEKKTEFFCWIRRRTALFLWQQN